MTGKSTTTNGFFSRLKKGLSKTHTTLIKRLDELTFGKREISSDILEQCEEILITADIGIVTVEKLMERITWQVERKQLQYADALHAALREEMYTILVKTECPLVPDRNRKPFSVLVVGVNGTGKTTTIGKLAHLYRMQGYSVMLGAADTFRAAAIEQLDIWGERVGCPVIKKHHGADPSAVVYDAMQSAREQKTDVLLLDTAGRLHTKTPLMEEIKKIQRTLGKIDPQAPDETLLVTDATTGQNGISQAALFKDAMNVTGMSLSKLDGTAKGGVIVAIAEKLQIPIRFVGVGEKIDDLRPFDARSFVDALFDNST